MRTHLLDNIKDYLLHLKYARPINHEEEVQELLLLLKSLLLLLEPPPNRERPS